MVFVQPFLLLVSKRFATGTDWPVGGMQPAVMQSADITFSDLLCLLGTLLSRY